MLTQSKEKKFPQKITMKMVVILVAVIAVISHIVGSVVESNHKRTAEHLAEYGEKSFIEEVLPAYISKLQNHGINDLSVNPIFSYSYDYNYNKSEKSLDLKCKLEFTSSNIDKYFTTGYNGSLENKLADVMKGIRSYYIDESQTFTLDGVGTVTVSIYKPDHEIAVKTPAGREYKLVYGYIESVRVEIDGDWVYSADEANTDKIFGETPYVGLSEDHINHTELGFYDDVEYCKDYHALRVDRRSATYIWYDDNGKEIFSAYIYGDEVISTTDRRNGKFVVTGPGGK